MNPTRDLLMTEVIAELEMDRRACRADPGYFIQRHCKIEDVNGKVIPFRFWRFQHTTIEVLSTGQVIIVLKARRLGLSWLVLAYALWMAIFQQGSRILILCKNEDDANELLDRMRRMRDRIALDPLSAHILVGLPTRTGRKARDQVSTLDVGDSTIRALVGKASAARSETAALVILDEFAFQKEAGGIWQGVYPTIEGGGQIFVISTGNGTTGEGEEFYNQWVRTEEGKNEADGIFWPWDVHPGRDPEYRDRMERALGDADRAKAEYPATPDEAFVRTDVRLTFPTSGVNKAVELGRRYDAMLRAGTLPPPIDNELRDGLDYGEFTQGYVIWPLPGGGIYVPPSEVVAINEEAGSITDRMMAANAKMPYRVSEVCYDAAGAGYNRTFVKRAEEILGKTRVRAHSGAPNTVPVPFNKYKAEVVGYRKQLYKRTALGAETRIIAISPENTELIRQERDYVMDEKEDDHGPDALTAGMKPTAVRFRRAVEAAEAAEARREAEAVAA